MKILFVSIKIFLFFTILTGIVYPLVVTGIAQLCFNSKANGSLIVRDGIKVGSELIGQQFDSAVYFISRPSAVLYNPIPSGGSNFGLTNSKLKLEVEERRKQFVEFNLLDSLTDIPSEMLFASASGLDPHISPRAALLQVSRIASKRNYSPSQKQKLIQLVHSLTEQPQFLCLGNARINVTLLNIETDRIK
jgi:K+-transporting ATPase ATPase C chain